MIQSLYYNTSSIMMQSTICYDGLFISSTLIFFLT